ncbi:hypothetical protein V6Z11_A10G201600 [Gossypium hirsutum]
MSHSVKIYDTCIGCTQQMIPKDGCKAKQISSAPRIEDCVGCKRCEFACPTDFLNIKCLLVWWLSGVLFCWRSCARILTRAWIMFLLQISARVVLRGDSE